MASRTSNPTTCPVCSKEFNAKREKVALNQHIQRAAASKDPTISTTHQQWLDNHTVHDDERQRARLAANSAHVQWWRASHPGKYKEQNANAEKKWKLQKQELESDDSNFNDSPLVPPSPVPSSPVLPSLVSPSPVSESHLMANPYYLLSLLGMTINPAVYTVAEVRESLKQIEDALDQKGSYVHNYLIIYIYIFYKYFVYYRFLLAF